MTTQRARFGIWAPVRGAFGARGYPGEAVDASYARNRDSVIAAEKLGYETVLFAYHLLNSQGETYDQLEAWTASAAVAAVTSKIDIIAAVKPLLMHPVVLSKMALQIEEIAQGRFAINFVGGWFRPESEKAGIPFPEHDERYVYGAEWLTIVETLLRGATCKFSGKYFTIDNYVLTPASAYRARPRIYLGGESDPALDLAAKTADVLFLNPRSFDGIAEFMAKARARPRQGAPLAFALPAFVVARETQKQAEEELEFLRELVIKEKAAQAGWTQKGADDKSYMHFKNKETATEIGSRGGTAAGLIGSYDYVAERLFRFGGLGIETFMLQFQPFEADMARFADEVIPRVRALEQRAGAQRAAS
jgi:alkanesulfonate monooxygenase